MLQHPVRVPGTGAKASYVDHVMKLTVAFRINRASALSSWQGNFDIPSARCAGDDRRPSAWKGQGVLLACLFTTEGLSSLRMSASISTGVQSHLALCCKATLPIVCMGHVRVRTSEHERQRPLSEATRCLARHPGSVSHLEVSSIDVYAYLDTRHLVALRCAMPWYACPLCAVTCMSLPLLVLCHSRDSTGRGLMPNAALCFCSLLANLRKLTLGRVTVSLPTLQPVATRLHELSVSGSRLQGSADGFLTKGWTALTSLDLTHSRMDKTMLTAALNLPALEDVHICSFRGYRGGELQLDQLTAGSCPQVSRLVFKLVESSAQVSEASRQSCRLLNLKRLAELHIISWPLQAKLDLDLPPSLTQLILGGAMSGGGSSVDFLWALQEAVKCVGRGAQLHKLVILFAQYLQPAQWGASLDEQNRRLGGQLGSLKELVVQGGQVQLLSALGAVASAAPSLVRLEIVIMDLRPRLDISPICSASLKSIRVKWAYIYDLVRDPPQVLLTLLPGCTPLQEVVVQGRPGEGAAVKIRCHRRSRRCIVPVDGYADPHNKVPKVAHAGSQDDMAVKLLHMPPSEQGVQDYTVLCACHAAGPEQARVWGHAVMPGIV